jgi:tetratricopeptide (TPR) repeat protein
VPHLERRWWERIDPEYDNIRATLGRCRDRGDPDEIGLRLVGGFWLCWMRNSWSEAADWAHAFLELSAKRRPTVARIYALWTAGWFASYLGNFPEALALADEAQALSAQLGSTIGLAYVSFLRGSIAFHQSDFARVGPFAREAIDFLQSAEARGEGTGPYLTAVAKWLLAMGFVSQRRFAEARALLEDAAAEVHSIGELVLLGSIRSTAGIAALFEGDLAEATAAYTDSANVYREAGYSGVSAALTALGEIALRTGDVPGAASQLREALRTARAAGFRRNVAENLLDFGVLAGVVDQPERGARLLGAAEALRGVLNVQIPLRQYGSYLQIQSALRAALGTADFSRAWAEGRAMALDQAIAYALADDEPASRAQTF